MKLTQSAQATKRLDLRSSSLMFGGHSLVERRGIACHEQ
jgi:hypothetical protein